MENQKSVLDDPEILKEYESKIGDLMKAYCGDTKITESINETGFPDALVLSLLTGAGYEYNSINDFQKIIKVVRYNDETKTYQLSIIPTLREDVIRMVMDLEVKPKYTCNEEVIECE